jgi:hypothetical protein
VDSKSKAVRRGTSPIWVEGDDETVTVPRKQLGRGDYSDRHDSILQDAKTSAWERWFQQLWDNGLGNSFLGNFFSWLSSAWRLMLLLLLILIAGLLLYLLFRSKTFRVWITRNGRQSWGEDVDQQRAKVSDLPFEIEQPIIGLRAQAERLRNSGDYSKAIIYLYSYLLVELDTAHCIRLERGKTNGAYMRELRCWNDLAHFMRSTIRMFEFVYFGRRQIDRDVFEELWSQVPNIEETLAQIREGKRSEDLHQAPAFPPSSTATSVGVMP